MRKLGGVIYHDGDVDCFLFIVSFLLGIRASVDCIIQWRLSESSSLPSSGERYVVVATVVFTLEESDWFNLITLS